MTSSPLHCARSAFAFPSTSASASLSWLTTGLTVGIAGSNNSRAPTACPSRETNGSTSSASREPSRGTRQQNWIRGLAAAECTGEADQQQRPFPHADQRGGRQRLDHRAHLGRDGRVLLVGRRAEGASAALEDQPHAGVRRGRDITSGLVRLRYRVETLWVLARSLRYRPKSAAQRAGTRGSAVRTLGEIGPVDAVGLGPDR
jgi:hypothetical protein